jgi:hypothetical protein
VLLSHLASFADRLAEPAFAKIKRQIHRLLLASAIVAAGIAFLVAGIAYFASSLWHALVPVLGNVGADLLLGALYAGVAAMLLLGGLRLVR